ncbi:MAG: ABC transporter substrate-binding protein [Betaproteobacteria bacterium]|nr:ABC transporter substrate-binding protein [Betaproteobacteria bacterium]
MVGKNLTVDIRYAHNDPSALPALAEELIALKPDVLVGNAQAAIAMMAKTAIIPIVFLLSADPVAEGLVESLARPGTNATGMSYVIFDLIAKHVELLTELVPKMSRVALLIPSNISANVRDAFWENPARAAAKAKRLTLVVVSVDPKNVPEAFAMLEKERPDALVVGGSLLFTAIYRELADAALRLRLPAIYVSSYYTEGGGLVSFGANIPENFRYAASYVDRILKGAKPADLPVEQVSRFELVLNLKTARQMGLTIPPSFRRRVDRIIE